MSFRLSCGLWHYQTIKTSLVTTMFWYLKKEVTGQLFSLKPNITVDVEGVIHFSNSQEEEVVYLKVLMLVCYKAK